MAAQKKKNSSNHTSKLKSTTLSHSVTPKNFPPLDQLESLFELLSKHQVGEFEWENGDCEIKVRSQQSFIQSAGVSHYNGQAPMHAASLSSVSQASSYSSSAGVSHSSEMKGTSATQGQGQSSLSALASNQKQILSPFVGTYFKSPSPTASPYVSVGKTVKKGEVLCIVEAMKLMNEIESEYNGKIISVLVENGQPVEYGEPLYIIELM